MSQTLSTSEAQTSKRRALFQRSSLAVGAAALALSACASTTPCETVHWEATELWSGNTAIERVAVGRPDHQDPRPQIVGVNQGGQVVLAHWSDGSPATAEVIYTHPSELTGLCITDLDPDVPGEEIYVGGHASQSDGGAVIQLSITPTGPKARRVWFGSGYVHSINRIPGPAPRLLITTYRGEIRELSPTPGAGTFTDRLLFEDPDRGSKDPEQTKIKDVGFLADPAGGIAHEALVVWKTGRAFLIDVDQPKNARLVHTEQGGLSRVTEDSEGGVYVTGYEGRVLHVHRDGAALKVECIDREATDSGLRGVVRGRFPLPHDEVAPLAIFGFHCLVRALTPRLGAFDVTTIYRDIERGHALLAWDLVAGNDADELIIAGYSKRIAVLVARRTR